MAIESDSGPCSVRVVNIYATRWQYRGGQAKELEPRISLGRLKPYYDVYRDQLPKLLPDSNVDPEAIALETQVEGVQVTGAKVHLFTLPSNQVVIAVTFEFTTNPLEKMADAKPITTVLEQCIDGELTIEGTTLTDYVQGLSLEGLSMETANNRALLPERHQLVFVTRRHAEEPVPGLDIVGEIVYRDEPPYREEFTAAKQPEQLNLRIPADPRGTQVTMGVVTPYVSLIYGHERFVEDSIFLSTVQAVGTASRFRQIWLDAYTQVKAFREEKQKQVSGQQIRSDLEDLADSLGNLEFDLTFSVEFPLMRIESFHSALYEAMDLSVQAQALSQMFAQLAGSLRSEITAIDIRERRAEETRQKWNSFAAALLSLVGVPVGFVVTFLGINAMEVNGEFSLWDNHYWPMYFVAAIFALVPVFLIAFPYVRDWSKARGDTLVMWMGLGLVLLGGAYEVYNARPTTVLGAVINAFAYFLIFLGLATVAEWVIRRLKPPTPDA